jgi:hypothetical protein
VSSCARGKSRGGLSEEASDAREWKEFCDEKSQKEGAYLLCISRHSHHPRGCRRISRSYAIKREKNKKEKKKKKKKTKISGCLTNGLYRGGVPSDRFQPHAW